MSDTIEPIDARQARCLTVKRAIAISYGTDGRYEELVYDREPCRRRAQYCTDYERFIFDRDFRYRNGTNYLDALLGGFNWEGVRNAGFDPDAEPKVYAVPDDMPLYRWVLKDGTVVTHHHRFSTRRRGRASHARRPQHVHAAGERRLYHRAGGLT